jgi:hypothetical protein
METALVAMARLLYAQGHLLSTRALRGISSIELRHRHRW